MRRCGLEMLLMIAKESSLDTRLQFILPYTLRMFDEKQKQQPKVIAKAIEVAITMFEDIVSNSKMYRLNNTDHQIFSSYIMPHFTRLQKYHKDN
jgi:hypothetical protein